jgi:hypothetical protein
VVDFVKSVNILLNRLFVVSHVLIV